MTQRDEKGRLVKGTYLTPEWREKISKGQQERHRRIREQQESMPRVELKRCTGCKQWKDRFEEFSWKKHTLKSGEVRRYPVAKCKKCQAKKSALWKAKRRAELGDQGFREEEAKWSRQRNQAKKRRYNRQYLRMQRRLEGIPERGPWKRYAHELSPGKTSVKLNPARVLAYFERYLVEELGGDGSIRLFLNGIPPCETDLRYLSRLRKGEYEHAELDKVDEIATRHDLPLWEIQREAQVAA